MSEATSKDLARHIGLVVLACPERKCRYLRGFRHVHCPRGGGSGPLALKYLKAVPPFFFSLVPTNIMARVLKALKNLPYYAAYKKECLAKALEHNNLSQKHLKLSREYSSQADDAEAKEATAEDVDFHVWKAEQAKQKEKDEEALAEARVGLYRKMRTWLPLPPAPAAPAGAGADAAGAAMVALAAAAAATMVALTAGGAAPEASNHKGQDSGVQGSY
ncbi:hypothetical protein QBC40DRAFT_293469 [Triangularia verruculosa]|uniref:Uncharacterized protein n=1 Tax=Triangularia verruculosa TaxID=2587418 RepID=A0AAN6XSS6_9PEZI|nr:hypothetical protein QBC40DRAFT_293469 [Triangularia verruculosa]